MAPNRRHTTSQKKAEEDVICEANFTAAIQAIREKKTKNLQTAAAEFKVSYHTLHRRAQNLTKPHLKAHKNSQLLTEGQKATIFDWAKYLAMTGRMLKPAITLLSQYRKTHRVIEIRCTHHLAAINRSYPSTLNVTHGSSPTRQVCAPILSHAPFGTSTYSPLCAGGW
ncbi:hypothetical protein F4604DRAFT_1955295 [Suillus subluteus]|nr:hypothetical protein F4604DRAFT_1955295 [Suillus subluteus]